jgi:membrane-associated phospholipid phosphatase
MAAERQSAWGRLLVAALLLAMLALTALAVDLALARWFSDRLLPGELRRLVRLSEAFAWGGTAALIVLAAALLDPRGWRVVPRLAIGAFGAGLLADVVKLFVARMRPTVANLNGQAVDTFVAWLPALHADSHGHKLQSFPSAHTATAVGLAIALAALYPRGRWLFAGLAVLAGIQRLEAQAHFLSDVLAGAAIGCLLAAFCSLPEPLGRWVTKIEHPAAH